MNIEAFDETIAAEIRQRQRKTKISYLSSGSTGAPTKHWIGWAALRAQAGRSNHTHRILLLYPPDSFAGLSVIAFAEKNKHTLLVVNPHDQIQIRRAFIEATYLPLTPTQIKWLMMWTPAWKCDTTHIEQIVLGGEATSSVLLKQVTRHFPKAHISTVYASSEAGICFVVHDGKGGIPLGLLRENPKCQGSFDPVGQLILHRSGKSDLATGDYFSVSNGRAYFKGRKQQQVSVGGLVVSLEKTAQCLQAVPGVVDARVIAIKSCLTGNILKAEIVGNWDEVILQQHLKELPREARPRWIEPVEVLPQTHTGKAALCTY